MSSTQLPLEYLVTSSENCLEAFELARLNQISNLRKEFSQVFDEWVEAEIAARTARWVLDGRRSQSEGCSSERLASTRGSSRNGPARVYDPPRARLLGGETKSRQSCDSKNSLASGSDAFLQAGLFGESNRELRAPPLDRESQQRVSNLAIALDACAALETLELSSACDLRRARYRGTRTKETQRKSANRSPMLPFPEAHHSDASKVLLAGTVPEASPVRANMRDESHRAVRRKVLSLPSVRRNRCSGVRESRGASRLAASDGKSAGKARGVVRQFPPVRAARVKPLVYGNVALSHF
jgi:hypothetical protein